MKTRSCPLKYYRIKRVERKETASVLWLKGVKFPFKVPRPPTSELQWAGLLHLGDRPWLLYEYSEENFLTLEERYKYMSKRSKTLAGSGLSLAEIEPLTKNQLEAFESDKNLILHGIAGTGRLLFLAILHLMIW